MIKIQRYSATELDSFRDYQRQTYEILESIANTLELGMSENQVSRALRKAFHLAGAHNYVHVPVALFGERNAAVTAKVCYRPSVKTGCSM